MPRTPPALDAGRAAAPPLGRLVALVGLLLVGTAASVHAFLAAEGTEPAVERPCATCEDTAAPSEAVYTDVAEPEPTAAVLRAPRHPGYGRS